MYSDCGGKKLFFLHDSNLVDNFANDVKLLSHLSHLFVVQKVIYFR